MNEAVLITDPGDPRLEPFRRLRDRNLKSDAGLFVGEGPLTVERMLGLPGVTRSVLVVDRWADRYAEAARAGVEILTAAESLLSDIIGFAFHRGVLATGDRSYFDGRELGDLIPGAGAKATLLCVDGVTNVDNIGLLFRNAAAFACDGVVLSDSCHDPLYRKALRVSLGHVLSVPWSRASDWNAALLQLKDAGVELVAAALREEACALDDYEVPDRVALVVGQESVGVSQATLDHCDRVLRIPMAEGVDSLNVAAASAVCLHRLSRGLRR
ncbi:MAG: RNA methyltransferase [Planctomycetes bacterium]|nr:RNA methyltransferase [Planctomycetota bacterium]